MSLKLQVPQQFPRSNFDWQPLRQGILINFWRTAESMANIFHKFSMRNDEFQFAKRQWIANWRSVKCGKQIFAIELRGRLESVCVPKTNRAEYGTKICYLLNKRA